MAGHDIKWFREYAENADMLKPLTRGEWRELADILRAADIPNLPPQDDGRLMSTQPKYGSFEEMAACIQAVTPDQIEQIHKHGECWLVGYDRRILAHRVKALWLWRWDQAGVIHALIRPA